MEDIDRSSRVCITMSGMVDGSAAQLDRVGDRHVEVESSVKNTVRKCRSRTHREPFASHASAIRVDVKQLRALLINRHSENDMLATDRVPGGDSQNMLSTYSLIPSSDHCSHGQSHSLVVIHHVAQDLRSCRYRDAFLVAELVQPASPSKFTFPVLTVSCTTSHRSQEVRVDLNDLLNRARCYYMSFDCRYWLLGPVYGIHQIFPG